MVSREAKQEASSVNAHFVPKKKYDPFQIAYVVYVDLFVDLESVLLTHIEWRIVSDIQAPLDAWASTL